MNNISDYSVGQIVYVKLIGNAARYENELIQEWVIVGIGRKYITARPQFKDEIWNTQFEQIPDEFNNQFVEKTNHSPRFIIYQSMQEIKDEEERMMLLSKLREQFYYGTRKDLSLDQLRTIDRVIKGEL